MSERAIDEPRTSGVPDGEPECACDCKVVAGLRESETRYRHIFDKAPTGYHELDMEGRIIRVNSTEADLLGYTPAEMVGRFAWEFVENQEGSKQSIHAKLRGSRPPSSYVEKVYRRKDGTTIDALIEDVILTNAAGEITGIRTTLQDISDRKRLEKQLLHSQKLEGVGMLAGGIAHDFNNLLAMILGSAELLKKHLAGQPHLKKYIERIIEASERGTSISRQLLMFSRPDESELKPVSTTRILHELQEMLRHFLPKTVTIRTDIGDEENTILGDAGQIHQALLNLALNANDAMAGEGTLTIARSLVSRRDISQRFANAEDCEHIALSVTDTGIGMEDAMIEKIFEPFFSTKERSRATGLGLSIVHGIVKNHRGFTEVQSAPGRGTTVTMFLPVFVHAPEVKEDSQACAEEPHSETLLLVDDEDMLRETMAEFLEEGGYRILTASNGKTAIDMFRRQHRSIDLVVTDLGMPEMGGEELFGAMRLVDEDVHVIVSSGYLDGTSKVELKRMGVKEVLTKPFKMQELERTIRAVLDSRYENSRKDA